MIKRIIKPLVWLYCWIRYGRRKRAAYGPTILYFETSPEYKAVVERWLVPNMQPTGR
ncbi:hypothetical protein [Stenotrophomonas sp. GD03657]|uniref:hypothetical protein n=1 Tax=Stenotrophomonas sp. GD03657 TaxID=2975363 RepID=UPI00244A45B5|nr:hypothetical protein [Stenotrophomonas sp. GD03657]MDH2154210.1 hypothetical protein [Stenotrophomonas sp. GD03657]